jgi:hypothetical protein
MGLPYDIIDRLRAQRFGERRLRRAFFEKVIH